MESILGNKIRNPKRFHLRFFDTKIIYEYFSNKDSAQSYLSSLNFIKKEMEIYDSKFNKIVC
jgi:hypothetical protein